jgi:hypothetical protein
MFRVLQEARLFEHAFGCYPIDLLISSKHTHMSSLLTRLGAFYLLVCLMSTSLQAQEATSTIPANDVFWQNLTQLCGRAYEGQVVAAPEQDTTFKNKKLYIHFIRCTEDEIRIPLTVGDDHSRTWVLTRRGDGRIQLKHDHRHKDGTPDRLTQYGGTANNVGLPTQQVFPADQETADLLPRVANNVWWMELIADNTFSYGLQRMGSNTRFCLQFDLSKEVEAPLPPWGYDTWGN